MSVEVPEDWEAATFGEVFDFKGGNQPPKDTFVYEPTDGYVRLLQIRDFESDDKPAYIPIGSSKSKCEKSDILIARYGASLGRILTGMEGAYNVALVKLIFDRDLDRGFAFHWLNSEAFQTPLFKVGSRSAQAGFNKADLAPFPILIPPLSEQQRIAEILSSVDQSIRATEAVIAQAERVKRGLMEDLLTGGLGSAAIANGKVPDGWKTYTLEEVIQIDWGDTNITKKSYVDDGFVAYSAAGGDGFLPHFDHDREGIVVSAIGANSGRMFWAEGRWSAIKNTMVAFPKSSYINLKFFFYYAQQQDFWPISGGAQPFIGLKNARMARLVIPDAMQQDAAVRAISSVDDQITTNRATVEQLQRLKRGMMDDLLTGKVRTVA